MGHIYDYFFLVAFLIGSAIVFIASEFGWRLDTHLAVRFNGRWKGSRFTSLTRGEVVGYDVDPMAFKITMKNGKQIVQCQISDAALGEVASRWGCRPSLRRIASLSKL